MFFVLYSLILLSTMLSGFFLIEKEWMEASISIVVLIVLIFTLIRRYKKRGNGKASENGYCDCDCLPLEVLPGFRKLDCDGGDCDVTPDCSP